MKDLEMNPYVIQIDKFVSSLEKLSEIFLRLENPTEFFSEEQLKKMCEKVCEKTCGNCESRDICVGRGRRETYELILHIFQAVENCGMELNVEVKRKVQKYCVQAPKFLRNTLSVYKDEKQNLLWNHKIAQNREGYVSQMGYFAKTIQHATRELDASIFSDEHLERKIRNRFGRLGLKILTMVFLVTEEGRYEIHVTTKAPKGECITTKELARIISDCCGRSMTLGKEERAVLGAEYSTVTCVEGPRFYTLQGVAKIGKGRRKISGDSFSLIDMPNGKQGVILSDGMGSGESAYKESSMVIELLEELLGAGFPKETALQMMNTAFVIGREEVRFSTVDISEFDLYSGKCEFVKAGASTTFIKGADGVECIKSTSLPIGVISRLELEKTNRVLKDGDVVVMVTDGVMDALPSGQQEILMRMVIEGTRQTNPKEIAEHILEQVLECSGEVPVDDMMVMAVGIWSLEK